METRRRLVLAATLGLIALPALIAASEAVSFRVANRTNGSMIVAGKQREYLLHVPRSYDAGKPMALVISLHAAGLWPAAQQRISRWNELADREGFLVVYPAGVAGDGPRIWNVNRGGGLQADIDFIAALIDTLQTRYNIDASRVYANGLSNGGGMSFALSCLLSDRIAAVGMVGAAQTLPWSWCAHARPMPMMAFHGTADGSAPYHGGTSWITRVPFPSVELWTANWARRNRCTSEPNEQRVAHDVVRRAYTGCADGASVVLYTIMDGGHTWPGGLRLPVWFTGRTTSSVDATAELWQFFGQHAK